MSQSTTLGLTLLAPHYIFKATNGDILQNGQNESRAIEMKVRGSPEPGSAVCSFLVIDGLVCKWLRLEYWWDSVGRESRLCGSGLPSSPRAVVTRGLGSWRPLTKGSVDSHSEQRRTSCRISAPASPCSFLCPGIRSDFILAGVFQSLKSSVSKKKTT